MKVIFLGTPQFVQPIKHALAKHFTLVESLSEADLAVVAAYGKILSRDEVNTPKYGCINIHPSLLPKYRGPSPIQAAILNGDKITGISIIKIDEEIDHGPVIYQKEIVLSDSDNYVTLSKKLFQEAANILPKIIQDFVAGNINLQTQNHAEATFTKQLTRETGYFDIKNPPDPEKLNRMVRAYFPWPGVWTKWSFDSAQDKNGKIVKFLPEGKLQMEGKKPINLKDFLNGYPDFPLKIV